MSSGPRRGVDSTTKPREEGNDEDSATGRKRVTYTREFLLAVGGSEACRHGDKLPAGFDASVSLLSLWCGRMLSLSDQLGPGEDGKGARSPAAWKWVPRSDASRGGHGHGAAEDSSQRPREPESSQTGARSKWPCTRFFSTAGCCFGENCRFIHYFPGSYQAPADPPRSISWGPAVPDDSLTQTAERKLGKYMSKDNSVPLLREQRPTDHCTPQQAPIHGTVSAASFGASATAKISVAASLAGAIIGRGGVNIKQISRDSGAKVRIQHHESDSKLKNVELQGTFDQIKKASTMVMELIGIGSETASNFKTKLCGHFARGSCTYGDNCRSAHSMSELRKPAIAPRDRPGGW